MFKRNKIYKIVYETHYRSDGQRTLLVVAKNPTYGLKKFYELVDDSVTNIVEFTEIKTKEGVVKTSGQS